jgi:non-heme chloroperoxidase
VKVNDGLRESFWLMGMQSIKREYDCIHEFSDVD